MIAKARVPTVILTPNGPRSAWRVAAKEENSIVDKREDRKVHVLAIYSSVSFGPYDLD